MNVTYDEYEIHLYDQSIFNITVMANVVETNFQVCLHLNYNHLSNFDCINIYKPKVLRNGRFSTSNARHHNPN